MPQRQALTEHFDKSAVQVICICSDKHTQSLSLLTGHEERRCGSTVTTKPQERLVETINAVGASPLLRGSTDTEAKCLV